MKVGALIGTALVGSAALLGCSQGSFSFNYVEEERPSRVVVLEPTHVCTSACAHYYHEGHYVVVKRGHRHGPRCGHTFDGRRWIVAVAAPSHVHVETQPARARVVHIPPPPGHVNAYVYDRRGSKWLRVSGKHVHGPGCGHIHVEGHWCVP